MEIRIWNWCKQAVLVTTGKWMKLNYFFSVLDVHVSWYVFRLLFFLRKPIQIAYKLKCSKTQQVWPSFIFNNELKYFWRHFLFCHAPAFSQDISELFIIRLLKLRYSEKATKFEKIFHLTFDATEYRQISGRFFFKFVPFSEYLNFMNGP